MPWKGQTMEQRREEFVRRVLCCEKTKSALCREYEITRRTGDKWLARYQLGEPMADRSRAPFHTPNKVDTSVESTVVELRRQHPTMGAKKLKRMLENKGQTAPAYSTINAILHRNGLISKEASAAATPYERFEKERPNEMWQADFKGHYAMQDGNRCHPLTVVDDHSRYCVCLDAKEDEQYKGTAESFTRAFDRYGLPDRLLCDNGNPWGTSQSTGYTRFEVWLMDLGILTVHGRIRHPQTQGKDERFNGTLLKECIRGHPHGDMEHAQRTFDEYRHFYNTERPHHALLLEVPSSRYCESRRRLPSRIDEWTYGEDVLVRHVKRSGYITLRGQGYFLSEALGDKVVGLIESGDEKGVCLVLYRQFCIAKINMDQRVIIAKKAFLFPSP